jgi:DNA ligase-1
VLIAEVVEATAKVASTPSRLAKVAAIADVLSDADPAEVPILVAWLAGELPQRQIGVGWASLRDAVAPAVEATLTVVDTDSRLTQIGTLAGPGSKQRRAEEIAVLFGAATAEEQAFLRRLLGGELRQGALGGVMADAVARAAGVPGADVRRAAMLGGDLALVARDALAGGAEALAAYRLVVGRPLRPMLAQPAGSVAEALHSLGDRTVIEAKLDGARIQVHRDGEQVSIFTRTLDDVTTRLPEIVEVVRALPARTVVLDGEAIALRADGRPQPFQVTAARFGRSVDVAAARAEQPLTAVFFDLLQLDGTELIDEPLLTRAAALDGLVPPANRITRLVTDDAAAAQAFLDQTLAAGHEGVLVKSPTASYDAGRRGGAWRKVKPVHTLDLVVLAVERGSGRRTGTLSNIHLGARDPDGGFVMVGKTFKGMTDAMLAWQTRRFAELAVGPTDGYVVTVRPEQVVEIALDGVQRSSRYPGGVALRFARVVRYRDDKPVAEADTIDTVRGFL